MKLPKVLLRALLVALFTGGLSDFAFAGTFTATYNGGGIWEQDGGSWSTNAYPNNGHFVVINGNAVPDNSPLYNVALNVATPCTLGINVSILSLSLASGATLNVQNSSSVTSSGALVIGGLATLNSTNGGSQFRAGPASGVAATGVISMSDSGSNYISGSNDGYTFTVNSGGIVRGAGQMNLGFFGGNEHLLNFVNHGLIEATQPNNPLQIGVQQESAASNLTNDGTLRARGASTLRLRTFGGTASVFNSGGAIEAIENAIVRVTSGITVTGGTVTTSNAGTIRGDVPGGAGGTLKDLTNSGSIAIADQESITLSGTFVNNGNIAVSSTGNGAILRFANGTTLGGTGAVSLSNNGSNYLMAEGSSDALTIGSTATVQGAGNISPGFSGGSNMLKISNQGLLHANVSGAALVVRAEDFTGTPFTNTGTLRASNGGTLSFNGTSTLSTSGNIQVVAGSTVSGGGGIALVQTAGTIDLDGAMSFPLGLDLNGGQLVGNGVFNGAIRNTGGIVGPGHSPGKLTVNGNYTQGANGTLNIEIGGNTAGSGYDQLVVNGAATLGGTLNISTSNGYRPAVGDVFTIIAPQSFSGSFAQINATGLSVQANYASGAITVTVTSVPDLLLNISTRLRVLTDDKALIGGFIITGTEPKKVIVRAIGPSLSGVPGALQDPTLELFADNTSLATNDDWRQNQEAEIQASGVAPSKDAEAAIVRTLNPGNYTAVVRGKNNSVGIGVVEVYDLAQTAKAKLANISSRGFVDTGDNALIGGFIAGGSGGGTSTKVVIRALGPSLGDAGVAGSLANPTVQLINANGSTVRANDDWKSDQQAQLEAIGIQPKNDVEAALVETLPAGNYTAVVRGKGDTTGIGLVEVYNVP